MPEEIGDGRDLQTILAALASPVRREILGLIWDRDLPAGEVAAAFEVSAPTISQHLNVLRAGTYSFQVRLRGTFRLRVGGKEVLSARARGAAPSRGLTRRTRGALSGAIG